VDCTLLAGFTADYDKSSNKLYERHLHAECRDFLYPQTDKDGWAYDSADRLLEFKRGVLHSDGMWIDVALALPGVDSQRAYNLDLLGNWVDGGLSGSAMAVESKHDCAHDMQSRTTNNLNQVASLDGSALSYHALNRRVQKTVNGTTTTFYYDGQQVIEERQDTTLLRQYLWGQYIARAFRTQLVS
jgi:hypothetical protein